RPGRAWPGGGLSRGPSGATHTQANATQPLVLWRLAKSTAKAGLRSTPDAPLPVQRFVYTQERAALATQLRGAAQALAAIVARVLRSDIQLRAAEGRPRDADLRLAPLEHRYLGWLAEPPGGRRAGHQPARGRAGGPAGAAPAGGGGRPRSGPAGAGCGGPPTSGGTCPGSAGSSRRPG